MPRDDRQFREMPREMMSSETTMPGAGEIGTIVVLTRLLAGPVAYDLAIEEVADFATQINWQPVGDVLRSAVERSLDRHHIACDKARRLTLTPSGRAWLTDMLARPLSAAQMQITEPVMARKLCLLPHLGGAKRADLLADLIAHRQHSLLLHRQCSGTCPAETRNWQNIAEARLSAEMRSLDALRPRRAPQVSHD